MTQLNPVPTAPAPKTPVRRGPRRSTLDIIAHEREVVDREWKVAAASVLPVEVMLGLLANLTVLRQKRVRHEAAAAAARTSPTSPTSPLSPPLPTTTGQNDDHETDPDSPERD